MEVPFGYENCFTPRVAKDMMNFRGMEVGKDRNGNGPHCRRGKKCDSPIWTIFADDRDPVSFADSLILQKCREAIYLGLKFGIVDRFSVRVREGGALRVELSAPFEHCLHSTMFKLPQFLF